MEFVDLHTHSTASDGTDSPRELVQKAVAVGLSALALTDHDTIAGLAAAQEEGRKLGIEVIRGCEVAAGSQYGEVHFLALWVPEAVPALDALLEVLRQKRAQRNEAILDKLTALDIHLDRQVLLSMAHGQPVGRPHMAQMLYKQGYASSLREAFTRFLGASGKAYVPRELLPMEEVVSCLSKVGAVVCMAHPCLLSCPKEWLEQTLFELKDIGLHGIEAYHSEHGSADERFCVALAQRTGLCITGGSDYHGEAKPNVRLGFGHGGLRVSMSVLRALERVRDEIR